MKKMKKRSKNPPLATICHLCKLFQGLAQGGVARRGVRHELCELRSRRGAELLNENKTWNLKDDLKLKIDEKLIKIEESQS